MMRLMFPSQNLLTNYFVFQTLVLFEKKFNKVKEERDNIVKAKEALELSASGMWNAVSSNEY